MFSLILLRFCRSLDWIWRYRLRCSKVLLRY